MFIPILIFSDGLIPVDTLPGAISWMSKLDPLYHLLRASFVIEFFDEIYPGREGEGISYRVFFAEKDMDPDDEGALQRSWIYTVILCVFLRIFAVILLVVINHDGFGWLSKQIKKKLLGIEEKEEDDFDRMSMEYYDEEYDYYDDSYDEDGIDESDPMIHEEVHINRRTRPRGDYDEYDEDDRNDEYDDRSYRQERRDYDKTYDDEQNVENGRRNSNMETNNDIIRTETRFVGKV